MIPARAVALHRPPEWSLIEFLNYQHHSSAVPPEEKQGGEGSTLGAGDTLNIVTSFYLSLGPALRHLRPSAGGWGRQIWEEYNRAESQELIAHIYKLQASQRERPSLNAAPAV